MKIINSYLEIENKTFIIAEIGNSHNGNLKYAMKAIDSAKSWRCAVNFNI